MSYNVSSYSVKEISALTLKMSDLIQEDITFSIKDSISDTLYNIQIYIAHQEYDGIKGVMNADGEIQIDEIEYGGEGSGSMYDTLDELLKKTKGRLKVIEVWEGGDSVDEVTYVNGIKETKSIV